MLRERLFPGTSYEDGKRSQKENRTRVYISREGNQQFAGGEQKRIRPPEGGGRVGHQFSRLEKKGGEGGIYNSLDEGKVDYLITEIAKFLAKKEMAVIAEEREEKERTDDRNVQKGCE